MRVMLDTNILISSFIFKSSKINELINVLITIRTLYENNLLDLKLLVKLHNKFTSLNTYPGFLHKKTI